MPEGLASGLSQADLLSAERETLFQNLLNLSLSLSLHTHTNRYTSSLTHSLKMILYEVRLFCIHYYNIMYIMKCVNVCVCTYMWHSRRKSTFRRKITKISYLYHVVALTLLYLLVLVALQSMLLFPSYKGKRVDL